MSHQASAGFHKSEQFTTLTLIGGRDCIPGALLSQQSPDLWVHGGAIIEKNLCVGGNIGTDGYIIGNICADRALIGTLEEKHINEGINVVGDMNFNCGNVTNIGLLTVQTIAAANGCGAGNTLHLGSDVTIFGDLEVGANLIVNQTTILEGDLNVVGNSYFNGNITANHIDATSVCTPILECVETITGPDQITINPEGNVTNIIGKLNVDEMCVYQDTMLFGNLHIDRDVVIGGNLTVQTDAYFFGNVYGINFPSQGNVFGNLLVTDKLTTTRLCVLEDTELIGNVTARQNVTIEGNLTVLEDTYFYGNVYGLNVVTSWSAGTTGFQPNTPTTGDVVMSGTLNTTNGGTGLSSYVAGDMLYATAPNVLGPLAIGTNGQMLSVSGGIPTWITPGMGGSVTSVGLSAPSIFSVSGSPVTMSGTLTFTSNTQSANTVYAGPSAGPAAVPTFRSLVVADLPTGIPNSNLQNSSITVNGTGISVGGSPVSLGGVLTLTNTGVTSATAGTGISVSASTGAVTISNIGVTSITAGSGISVSASTGSITISSIAGGGGTVTSVGLTAPTSVFNSPATNSPITTSGTLDLTFITQTANTVFAGPTTGGPAVPTFRSLVVADLPTGIPNANLQNSAITVNAGTGISVSGSPVSLGGAITVTNTGVTSITAGTGISVNSSTGAVTITATGATPTTGKLVLNGPSSSVIWGIMNNNVYKYNPTTKETCFVGPTGLSTDIPFDMAFHPDGTLYAITDTAELYTLDPLTATATFVANVSMGGTNSMVISDAGVCYINVGLQDLATVDLVTGVVTVIGTIQTPGPITWTGAGDLAFFNGLLYYTTLAPSFALIIVNIATPSASTFVGNTADVIFGLATMNVGGTEYLYGLSGSSTNVYRIDETTGVFTETTPALSLPPDADWSSGTSQSTSLCVLGDQITMGRSYFYDKVTIVKDCSNEGDCVPGMWWANALTDELHFWNTLTNTDTLIGTLPVTGINNFAYFDGVLYGLTQSMLPGRLYTINQSTAAVTLLATFTFPGGSAVNGFNGLDIAPNGQFYATTSFSAPAVYAQRLFMLYPSTATYTIVNQVSDDGGTTLYAPRDLQFVQNDLYVIGSADELLKVNLANPLYSTFIAIASLSLGPLAQIVTGNECKLYGLENSSKTWYQIDLTTGVASNPSGTLPGLISVVGATSSATKEAGLCVNGDIDMLDNDIYNAAVVQTDNAIVTDLLVTRTINGAPYSVVVLDANATPYAPTLGDTKGVWYGLDTKANAFDTTSITLGNGASTKDINTIAIGVDSVGLNTSGVAVGANALADTDSVAVGASANQGIPYTTGTAGQSVGNLTGVGTNFTVEMVNGTIIFASGEKFLITGYTSPTSLTVFPTTPTVLAGTAFELYYSTTRTTAIGTNACQSNRRTGNTAVGYNSLALNQQGTEITSIGYRAMYEQDGSYSVAVGGSANYGSPYNIGLASQSGNTVTGTGTTFTAAMNGGRIIFANGDWAFITAFVSGTQVTVSPSQTVSSQAFVVYFPTSGTTAVGYGALTFNKSSKSTAVGFGSFPQVEEATYTKGTAGTGGVSSTTVTGVGTSWYSEMANGTIVFTGGVVATISSVTNRTTMVVSPAVTVANGTAYTVYLAAGNNTGVGVAVGGNLITGANNTLFGANTGTTLNSSDSLVSGSNNTLLGCYASCYPTNDETIAIGYKAKANETGSIAIGPYATINPTLSYCIAIGWGASVSTGGPAASSSIAIGTNSSAVGETQVSIGFGATCNAGVQAVSIGYNTIAATLACAIAGSAQALGTGSIAIGNNSQAGSIATDVYPISIGFNSRALVQAGISIGQQAGLTGNGVQSIAIGTNSANTSGQDSVAIGTTAVTNAGSAISIGDGSVANVINSIALGTAATTGTVAGGGSGLAITVPTDTIAAGDPGAATDGLIIMINGVRYKIHLTAFP